MKQNLKKWTVVFMSVFFLTGVIVAVVMMLGTVRPEEWDIFFGVSEPTEGTESGTEPLFFFIKRECLLNKSGEKMKAVTFSGLENGDVLVTDSTYCLGWRHGHAALVVDAARGITLEAYAVGTTSDFGGTADWEYYPRVSVLRLKAPKEVREQIAAYAKEELTGIPYRLGSGMIDDKDMDEAYWGSQCAHLVWLAFYKFGYDVDGDGGWLVTPYDLEISDCFEALPPA